MLVSDTTNITDTSKYIILNDGINENSSQNYEYRMWIDEATTLEEGRGKSVNAKVIAVATIKVEEPHGWSNSEEGSLLYALKQNTQIS